jgi:two-component system chemotaxis response regulator CheY
MPVASKMRVLIVDDQASMRGLTRHCLAQLGIRNIVEAKDGFTALDAIAINKFDLVISDWNMEGMDGLALLKQLRGNPLTAKTPFIMATGQRDSDSVKEAAQAGVNNYVVKPYNVATIKKKIEAVVGRLT